MGGGAFGVDAAAQYYFNKSARDVNLSEAAMLAGLFKAPTKFAPHINLPAARARANVVLDNLVEANMMTEGQVFGARRNPATPVDRRDDRAANYYLDWAFDEMKKLVDTFPKSMTERVFVVRTALDTGLQNNADAAVESSLRQYGQEYHAKQAAAVLMDVDGSVRAMVGGRDYGASQFNRATDAMRQPGSSFKPYVYATALENGFKPTLDRGGRAGVHRQLVPAQLRQRLFRLDAADPGAHAFDQHHRGEAVDRDRQRQCQDRPRQDREDRARHGHPHAAAGHAVAADRRRRSHRARPHRRLCHLPQSRHGGDAARHSRSAHRRRRAGLALRPRRAEAASRCCRQGVAADMIKMMNSVVENGTGKRARLDGVASAGKTGTTNAYRDAWFIGYTGNFVCGVWFGNDDYQSTNRMTGGSLPAMTWHNIMAYAHEGIELKQLPGVAVPQVRQPQVVAEATTKKKSDAPAIPPRPALLTKRGADALVRVERLMDDANRALAAATSSSTTGPVAEPEPPEGQAGRRAAASGARP